MFKRKTIIIAEAGVNHNGNIKIAKKMVDAAKACGADYIKFQTFDPDLIATSKSKLAPYQRKRNFDSSSQKKMLEKLTLTEKDFLKLFKYCEHKKIRFLSSPFDIKSIKFLKSNMKMDFFKIPSGEITNYPYLKYIAKFNKRILLSTGMASVSEIKKALNILKINGTKMQNISLLHCISDYPTKKKDVNLNFIKSLKKITKSVGFSDHTPGHDVSIIAVGLGASIIEKHFTLNKKMKGPDHLMSLDVKELALFIKKIEETELILGKNKKIITSGEKSLKKFARKSIVAKKEIKKGEKFSEKNLTTKRPGSGRSPLSWNKLLGTRSKKNYLKDELL